MRQELQEPLGNLQYLDTETLPETYRSMVDTVQVQGLIPVATRLTEEGLETHWPCPHFRDLQHPPVLDLANRTR